MHIGTLFVLIGTILFAVALVAEFLLRPAAGQYRVMNLLLATGGLLIGIGLLVGAPALS